MIPWAFRFGVTAGTSIVNFFVRGSVDFVGLSIVGLM